MGKFNDVAPIEPIGFSHSQGIDLANLKAVPKNRSFKQD